jgi:hypothetical protein
MTKSRKPLTAPPSSASSNSKLAPGVDRLANEIRSLREVMDDIREELEGVSKNGVSIQPAGHVLLKAMARDPLDKDWRAKLKLEYHPGKSTIRDSDHPLATLLSQLGQVVDESTNDELRSVLETVEMIRYELLELIAERGMAEPVSGNDGMEHALDDGDSWSEDDEERTGGLDEAIPASSLVKPQRRQATLF